MKSRTRRAEKQLQKGKGKGAESDERKAIASMKKALKELEDERKRIAKLPPEEFEKMAGEIVHYVDVLLESGSRG